MMNKNCYYKVMMMKKMKMKEAAAVHMILKKLKLMTTATKRSKTEQKQKMLIGIYSTLPTPNFGSNKIDVGMGWKGTISSRSY